jgi:hypothetical protein
MLGLKPARNVQPTRPAVILSAAGVSGTRRLCVCWGGERTEFLSRKRAFTVSARDVKSKRVFCGRCLTANLSSFFLKSNSATRFFLNSRRMRAYTNQKVNAFKMNISEMHDLNLLEMNTCEKICQGGTTNPRAVVPSGTTQVSPGAEALGTSMFPMSEAPGRGDTAGGQQAEQSLTSRRIITCTRLALKPPRMNTSTKTMGRGGRLDAPLNS